MNKTDTPEFSLLNSNDKDKKYFSQFLRIREYFKTKTASRYMAAVETDIPIQNVCRYVGMLFSDNAIAVIRKDKCAISGEWVEFLTTDPALFPKSNQLSLFGYEDE
jgi:hypothetical protein